MSAVPPPSSPPPAPSPSPVLASPAVPASEAPWRPGRRLVAAGVLVLVLSVAAGAMLLVIAQIRFDRLVEDFARAPAGCDTTLEFSVGGEFVLFVETAGRLEHLSGRCEAPTVYGRDPAARPRVQVSVFDPVDGAALELARIDPRDYSSGGFRGTAFRSFEVDAPGNYVARVQAPDGDDVVLAVGPDPFAAVGPMRIGGVLLAAAGAMAGISMFVVGLIRRTTARPVVSARAAPTLAAPGHAADLPVAPAPGAGSPTGPPVTSPGRPPLPPPPAGAPPSPPDARPLPPPPSPPDAQPLPPPPSH